MRKLLLIVGLQCYAVFLAVYQSLGAVRTDEAKYLLNIPYPHPPFARTVLSWMEKCPHQEMIWRIVFATLVVQAVWLVFSCCRNLQQEERITLCGMWLFAGSVLFQAGSIMMAPLTMLQGLVFVWLFLEDRSKQFKFSFFSHELLIAVFWLVSLFTAYQAVLYIPIVYAIFRRLKTPMLHTVLYVGVPVGLVGLYVLSNPLALASFANAGGQNASVPLGDTLGDITRNFTFASSVIFGIVGVWGVVRSKNVYLLSSLLLVVLFMVTSFRTYYGILYLPLLVVGVCSSPKVLKHSSFLLAAQIVVCAFIAIHTPLVVTPSRARVTMQELNKIDGGAVLIAGSFGHQWQYESVSPVYRYSQNNLARAKAVVCLERCPEVSQHDFYQIPNLSTEVWVRRQ